tara:strand:- start:1215 stop:1388 length:174 start_codon:yes stop_codon:yes gene_type:complete
MSKEILKVQYQNLIDNEDSIFMKNILEAELKHKLELLELGIENITPPDPDDCIACSG